VGEDPQIAEEDHWCRTAVWEERFREALTDDQLIRCRDVHASRSGGWNRTPADYRNELTRRATERQNQRLERLIWALVALTIVVTIATLVLVWSKLRH
jgi:hypothetical protein